MFVRVRSKEVKTHVLKYVRYIYTTIRRVPTFVCVSVLQYNTVRTNYKHEIMTKYDEPEIRPLRMHSTKDT